MVRQEPGWTARGPGTFTDDSSTTDSAWASRNMLPLSTLDASEAFVGIRAPFTIADALALHILRQDRRYRNLPCRKVEQATTETCDAGCVAVIGNGELNLTAQEANTFNLNQTLLQDSYEKADDMKLTSAGSAYAYCYMEVVQQRVERTAENMRHRGIKVGSEEGVRTDKQMTHDVQHVYEATVEVVDLVYWNAVLWAFKEQELKYPTPQKEDLLARVRQISDELKSSMKQAQRTEEHPDENFVAVAMTAVTAIGTEFDMVVDWFFDEWFPLQNNFWKAMNARDTVHASGAIMILLEAPIKNGSWTFSMLEKHVRERWRHKGGRPFSETPLNYPIVIHVTEDWMLKVVIVEGTVDKETHTKVSFPMDWPLEGETLSPELVVPGLLCISPSRDSAVTSELMAAYELSVEVLHRACTNYIAWEPTEQHMAQVQKLCNFHHTQQRVNRAAQAALGGSAE